MPRVLRIFNRLVVGGPVLNVTYLTKYMAPEFETLLVVGEREGHEKSAEDLAEQLGINFITVKGMGRSLNAVSDYFAYRRLREVIRNFKPDIVHTHAAKPGTLGRLAATSENVPVILHTFHGHVFHSYFNSAKSKFFINIERFLAKKTDAIIAISEEQKRELVYDFKIAPDEKFKVIPLGFDLDRFRADQREKRKKFRKEFNLDETEIAIGIIGRLVPVKNHYLFMMAIKHVFDNCRRKVKAFIIGDGETRSELEEIAQALNISFSTERSAEHTKPLVFTSWRSDVDVINAGLDIICLTSLNEGTPVSLIEAQAANKPVVSTRVGGIADIVKEGETALLADTEETELFSNHLLWLVENDELRKKMGERSHEHVINRFGYQRLVGDMSQLYYELLGQKK